MRRGLIITVVALLAATTLPAVAQDTLVGLGPVRGYTDVAFDTTALRYDILVDASRPEDPLQNRYRTIQAAYAAAPPGARGRPTVIGLMPDVYQLNGTETEAGLVVTKSNITFLGLTRDRRSVVLADNRGNKQGAANNGWTMTVHADGFSMINLTILNYCNLDYDYPGDPSKSLRKRSDVITQAVAIVMEGDRHVYSHVAMLSRLDTTFNLTRRSYFTHVYVEGTDDFIGVPGAAVWEDSEINFIEGGGIMLAGNTAFVRTRFRATKPMSFYKGVNPPVALIESTLPDQTAAWFGWRAPDHVVEQSLTYRSVTDSGRPVDMLDSVVGEPRRTLSRELTDAEMKAFNPWNMLRWSPEGSDDGWDPAGIRAHYEAGPSLPWRIALTNGLPRIRTGEAPAEILAAATPAAGASRIRWSSASPLVRLSATEGDRVTVTAVNTTDQTQTVPVTAAAENGFSSTAWVTVDPAWRLAPTLTGLPTLSVDEGRLTLDYKLNLAADRMDKSLISWFACADAACAHPERIAVSRGAPLRTLPISPNLDSRFVMAAIEPAHDISQPGRAVATPPVVVPRAALTSASTDLRSLPDSTATDRWEGDWSLTGAWSAEPSAEPGVPGGFRVNGEDSTLLYVGRPDAGDMDVTVQMSTDKYEGQGFAIPGRPDDAAGPDGRRGPYGEILFKYDAATRNGYSLRFWRSTRSATAVVFQLYRIIDGRGTPFGEDQLTGVVKPVTTIRIRVRDDKVMVGGDNTADTETLTLTGKIEPNRFGGAGFFWTASRRSGSVVLQNLAVDYP